MRVLNNIFLYKLSWFSLLTICLIALSSCEEEEGAPIYLKIPSMYQTIFQNIRALQDSDYITVQYSSGLNDRLLLEYSNSSENNISVYTNYEIPGDMGQKFYKQVYNQKVIPNLYSFYDFNYKIQLNTGFYDEYNSPLEDYHAIFQLFGNTIFSMNLKSQVIRCTHPYETLTNQFFNGYVYPVIYKINIGSNDYPFKNIYLSVEYGVVRAITKSDDILNFFYN